MRAILFTIGLVLASAQSADADSVVVMVGPEHDAAMRVVLAGRGTAVASLPAPVGQMRLERAAFAQRAAAQSGAHAAVWIDEGDICAVSSDGHDFRHAPFPPEASSPRAFAAIATSLLDEMIAPPAWNAGFSVNVDVAITPHGAAPPPRVALAGPPGESGVTAEIRAPERRFDDRTLFEIGPMVSPLTAGIEGGFAFPLSPGWRLAATGAINTTFDGNYVLGVGALEIRHVRDGEAAHWEIGALGGFAAASDTEKVVFAGARLGRSWELESSCLSISITPVLLHAIDDDTVPTVFPGAWVSVRWQLPL